MKFSRISDWLTDFFHDQFRSFANRSDYSIGLIAIALFCVSVLSWKLLIAIALGIAIAWIVFEAQQPGATWMRRTQDALARLWQTPTGKAVISGSCGSLLFLIGFGLTEVTGRSWIAATLMLQSLIGAGVFAIWHQSRGTTLKSASPHNELNYDRYIHDLAHPTLMRRMIAVKRLQHLIEINAIAPHEISEIRDYFHVLLSQETDPMIRLALQDELDHVYPPALQESSLSDFSVQVREIPAQARTSSLSAAN